MIYIIMGVSSSGKTLIGSKLADIIGLPFYDADNFHPPQNVRKMKGGQALDDEDRWPWLQTLRQHIVQWDQNGGAILACSSLKKAYRDILSPAGIPLCFIYLQGSQQVIAKRMEKRTDHFMPDSLLSSQFETLEVPREAITINIDQTPKAILKDIIEQIDDREQ